LTGSPAANGLLGLFGQCYALDLGKTFGELYSHFRANFFTPQSDHVWVPVQGGQEYIFKKAAPLALRMKAEDYMQLPEFYDHLIPIELPDDVRQRYEEMEEELLTMMDNNLITAANAGVAAGKCMQICSGAIYKSVIDPITGEPMSTKKEWLRIHDEKLVALEELIDELQGQQLLVAYQYRHELERFKTLFGKRFGKEMRVMGSGVSEKEEAKIETEWNRGNVPVLFGHPQSIGRGMNLQGSSAYNILWFTPTYNFELWDQYTRRLRRQGNTAKRLINHTFVVPNTVDMVALRSLARKDKTQNSFFEAISEYHSTKRKRSLPLDVVRRLIAPRHKAVTTRKVK